MLSQKQREWMARQWLEEVRTLIVRARQFGNDMEYIEQLRSRMCQLEEQGLSPFETGYTMVHEDPDLMDRLAKAAGLAV